jgi:hypothetical protein
VNEFSQTDAEDAASTRIIAKSIIKDTEAEDEFIESNNKAQINEYARDSTKKMAYKVSAKHFSDQKKEQHQLAFNDQLHQQEQQLDLSNQQQQPIVLSDQQQQQQQVYLKALQQQISNNNFNYLLNPNALHQTNENELDLVSNILNAYQ